MLCEMANLGLPVAPGFVVTTDKLQDPAQGGDVDDIAKEALNKLENATAHYLGNEQAPLLLSVQGETRMGNLGLNDAIVEAWENKEESRFVLDSYRRLILSFARDVKDLDMGPFVHEAAKVKQRLDEKCRLGRKHEDSD